MKTIMKALNWAVFMAAPILILCGPAAAQDNVIAQAGSTAQDQHRDRTLRHQRRPHRPAPTPPVPTGRLIDKSYFGMHIHNAATTTPWPPVTFGFVRLWDTGTDWASLQPSRPTWEFANLDKLVALAEAHGVEVVLTLGMTPRWASARPDEKCPYGTGCAAEPANLADWQNYVRTVSTRYRGRIKYYEVWNEPVFDASYTETRFFSGTAAKMVELASSAYAIIKQADPGAQVISPSSVYPASYIEPFLQAGGGNTFDIFATHYYVMSPEQLPQEVNNIKGLLTKYGLQDKPMWNTESGYNNTKVAGASQPSYVLDQGTAAARMVRHLILGASAGLARSAFYAWDNGDMGFVSQGNYELNAVGKAYGTATAWLIGTRVVGCGAVGAELWQCEVNRNGRRAWIAWSTAPSTPLQSSSLPAAIRQIVPLDGQPSLVVPPQISVGIAPMLLMTDFLPW